jgi:histone deacetylase 6
VAAPPNMPKERSGRSGRQRGTGLVFDPAMEDHHEMDRQGGLKDHPEQPARVSRIWEELAEQSLVERCVRVPAREATTEELLAVHDSAHVDAMLGLRGKSVPELLEAQRKYNSIFFSPGSAHAALLSAGSVVALVVGGKAIKCHDPLNVRMNRYIRS